MINKTYSQSQADVNRKWFVIDASGVAVGRLSTQIAKLLSGKDKPTYTPHIDDGDYVVVINASHLTLSGKKRQENKYRYSGYPGGIKSITKGELLENNSVRLLEQAVRGMLPKNKLMNERMKRLKVYPDADHQHEAQQPTKLEAKHGNK